MLARKELNAYADVFIKAIDLNFGMQLYLCRCFVYQSIKGSGVSAYLHWLVCTFVARQRDNYQTPIC